MFSLTKIKKLFSRKPIAEEIPSYPPFIQGLPYADTHKLLDDQKVLLGDLKQAIGLTPQEYKEIFYPVVFQYASFVHLLPASKGHHHREAGGLLHHGLDSALFAARRTDSILFSNSGSPIERKKKEKGWRVAAVVGALVHDIGKSVSDMIVSDESGDIIWNPHTESLTRWLQKNKLKRYWVKWNKNRHQKHTNSGNIPEGIIPTTTREWFFNIDGDINRLIIDAITEEESNHIISDIVRQSDIASTSKDMSKFGDLNRRQGELGVPIGKLIIDYMLQLMEEEWLVNKKGARVWNTTEGTFIVWKHACVDINNKIKKDNIKGIPRAADTLAKELINHNLAVPYESEHGNIFYWDVAPHLLKSNGKSIKLKMLKLSSPQLLFPDVQPEPIEADINVKEIKDSLLVEINSEKSIVEVKKTPVIQVDKNNQTSVSEIQQDTTTVENVIKSNAIAPQIELELKDQENDVKSSFKEILPDEKSSSDNQTNVMDLFSNIETDSAADPDNNPFGTYKEEANKGSKAKNKASKAKNKPAVTVEKKIDKETSSEEIDTSKYPWLNSIIELNKSVPDSVYFNDKKIHIKKDWTEEQHDKKPNEILKILDTAGVLYINPLKPSSKNHKINNISTIIVNAAESKVLNQVLSKDVPVITKADTVMKKESNRADQEINVDKKDNPKAPDKTKKTIQNEISIESLYLNEDCDNEVIRCILDMALSQKKYDGFVKKKTKKLATLEVENGFIIEKMTRVLDLSKSQITRSVRKCNRLKFIGNKKLSIAAIDPTTRKPYL